MIDEGDFAVPSASIERKDDWFVNGLTGTGSSSVSVENLDVPAHRYLSLPGLIMGNSPGASLHEGWAQRCRTRARGRGSCDRWGDRHREAGASRLPCAGEGQDDRLYR